MKGSPDAAEDILGVIAATAERCDAHTGRAGKRMAFPCNRLSGGRLGDATRDLASLWQACLRQRECELIVAEAGQDVRSAHVTADRVGYSDQQRVGRMRTGCLVQRREVVDVEHYQGASRCLLAAAESSFQPDDEGLTAERAGQRIP